MEIKDETLYITAVDGNGYIELCLLGEDANACYHSGACDDDVSRVVSEEYIQKQFKEYPDEQLIKSLKEYGAWSDDELQDRTMNEHRLLWLAAGNIIEGDCEEFNPNNNQIADISA